MQIVGPVDVASAAVVVMVVVAVVGAVEVTVKVKVKTALIGRHALIQDHYHFPIQLAFDSICCGDSS